MGFGVLFNFSVLWYQKLNFMNQKKKFMFNKFIFTIHFPLYSAFSKTDRQFSLVSSLDLIGLNLISHVIRAGSLRSTDQHLNFSKQIQLIFKCFVINYILTFIYEAKTIIRLTRFQLPAQIICIATLIIWPHLDAHKVL